MGRCLQQDVNKRLLSFGASVQRTQKHGTFDFYIDGSALACELMLKIPKLCLLHCPGRPDAIVGHTILICRLFAPTE
jgi:hypothetical protein